MSTHVEIKTHLWYTFISNSKTSKLQTQKTNYFFICLKTDYLYANSGQGIKGQI